MKLAEKEFFSFKLKSQIQILRDKGVCLFTNYSYPKNEIKAFLIFDFYVKVIVDKENEKITTILLMDETELADFVYNS
ncbi:MAG: hypothetical protein A3F72_13355 [Bacteroidetes bacterium RIFCSPLOWO2_12_FULL_35_15]|nr:MAG: hypothetical protein A3F72_13355 [Bacteroidetes bacterium RIFCSPLOWO2_12_FULL_35_15]